MPFRPKIPLVNKESGISKYDEVVKEILAERSPSKTKAGAKRQRSNSRKSSRCKHIFWNIRSEWSL